MVTVRNIENIDMQLLLRVFLQAYFILENYPFKVEVIPTRSLESSFDDSVKNIDSRSSDIILIAVSDPDFDTIGNEIWEERKQDVVFQVYTGRGEIAASAVEGIVRRFLKDWNEKQIFNNFRCKRDVWMKLTENSIGTKEEELSEKDTSFLAMVKIGLMEYIKSGISEYVDIKRLYGDPDSNNRSEMTFNWVLALIDRVQRVVVRGEENPNKVEIKGKLWRIDVSSEFHQFLRIKQGAD